MIGLVVSDPDAVSRRIGEALLAVGDWDGPDLPPPEGGARRAPGFELRTTATHHLETAGIADRFDDPDAVVFLSRHAGDTGPLLTAHFTGNVGPADHGGEARTLARACPGAARTVLGRLEAHAPPAYDVTMECTHHGPTDVGAPSMFVELGSGPDQWTDEAAATAVARAVIDLRDVDVQGDRTVVAFGGGHYAPRPTRIVAETGWAVGHVAADWALAELGPPAANRDVIDAVFAESGATRALVAGDRPALRDVIEDLGYRVVGESWLRETDGVPLSFVDRVERDLRPVGDGLRFGRGAAEAPACDVVDLPDDLLATAARVDADATDAAATATLVAYETAADGTAPAGRACVADAAAYDRLVDRAVAVLRERYDDVERRADAVVVRETAFDPAAARERGVPEGPAFGRLAEGEAVTVDGETVRPEAVRRERTRRFPV